MTYSMGNWDECLRVDQYEIKGQYCLVEASYDWTENLENNETDNKYTWPDERASVWNALKKVSHMCAREHYYSMLVGYITFKKFDKNPSFSSSL